MPEHEARWSALEMVCHNTSARYTMRDRPGDRQAGVRSAFGGLRHRQTEATKWVREAPRPDVHMKAEWKLEPHLRTEFTQEALQWSGMFNRSAVTWLHRDQKPPG
ncbi:hypothetical protein Zmor_011600 [Zophobas morio]|uniref:Uncharacterized protein n=1 Tax=Zophobas morio TaxID=2755281 RepID=A0AA38IL27_9CUCU|nr:hypothetical protein Zmor_011600 [Zophobas morio]